MMRSSPSGTRRKPMKIAVLALVAISVTLAVSGAASSQPLETGTPGVSILAQNGFGDHNNSFAWSMGWFRGKLYVGTGRDEVCVENETVQFYYPDSGTYVTNPEPDVHCPKNAYDMSLRAQIWQYTPTGADTGRWKMVFRSPVVRNPMDPHKMVGRDLAYRGMVVWTNPKGKQALFAAGVTPDEFMPRLLTSHPPVLMRSFDGVHWQSLQMPSTIVRYPGGNNHPMGFRTLMVWHGHLFVTATPDITGDGGVFEVINPWSNRPGLRQVSGPQYDVFEIQTFHGCLYMGTGNKQVGYGVYRACTYTNGGLLNFHEVVGNGAGRGFKVTSVVSMYVYRGRLYVGSSGWYNKGTIPASEMIRIAPNGQWQVVVGDPRTLPDGQTLYPVSGLYDGFYSPFAAHFWRMDEQGGGLYVGTNDWAYLVQEDKQYAWLQETVLAGVLGFNIWATCDGNDWFAVTRNAFTGDEYNFGGRTLVTGGPNGRDLYIGSANQAQGTTIFQDQGEACGSLVNDAKGVARPGELQTDHLAHGTLLSWDRSRFATSYEVERASFVTITVGLKAPPTLPNGWQTEAAMPTVTPVGAPGSVAVQLVMPGGFVPLATTTNPDYVAHTSGHYVYEVVAKTATGVRSDPSNVEVTPFAGPPATFSALKAALGTPASTALSKSRRATAASSSAAQSRLQRLLAAAETASARGEDTVARREVAELQASAGDNDELAAVATRIERRLQYANIAGAP